MQKLFDDQVSSAAHDRSLLMGNSEWASHSTDVQLHRDPAEQPLDQLRSDQQRMLGGNADFINNKITFVGNFILNG